MEKVNLFETKKSKTKQAVRAITPQNPSSLTNKTIPSNTSKLPTKSQKGTINKTTVDLNYVKQDRILNFYKLKGTNSKISCHGRPTPKQVRSMRQVYKVNYCLTLQKQKENPLDVLKYCQDNDIEWQLIELDGANIAYMKKKDVLTRIVEGLYIVCQKILAESLTLFIHCAAGLHRTGTVLYTLLRIFGETPESAIEAIGFIREDTKREVGNERVRIAETVIYPELLKKLKSNNIHPENYNSVAYMKDNKDTLLDNKNIFVNSKKNELLFDDLEQTEKKIKMPNNQQIINENNEIRELTNGINSHKLSKFDDKNLVTLDNKEKMKQIFEDLDS